MAYDVSKRFQEVARRQKEMDDKYKKKPIAPAAEKPIVYEGAGMRKAHPKDVNLPYESEEDRKRKKSIGPSYAR